MKQMFALLCFLGVVNAVIYQYKYEPLKTGHLEYRRVGMYAGSGANVKVQVAMTRTSATYEGLIEMTLVHVDKLHLLGAIDDSKEDRFCCSEDIAGKFAGCTDETLGRVILNNPKEEIQNIMIKFAEGVANFNVENTFEIKSSGRHYFMISSCLGTTSDVYMDGTISWKNPFGYLPGELYPLLSMYEWLTVGYLILAVVWIGLCLLYRQQLLRLQYAILAVIILGLFENFAWYIDYDQFNQNGVRSTTSTVIAVLLSSCKRSVSRTLVLVVCMGYGILTPVLSSSQFKKVTALGIVYFIFSYVHDLLVSYSQSVSITPEIRVFFVFPLAALDSVFFLWILQEISTNIETLTANQQDAKLFVFKSFWTILVITAIFSVGWASFQIYSSVWMNEDDYWQYIWVFDGIWHILYFFVLLTISFLWRPSSQTKTYALSEQLATVEEEDDEGETRQKKGEVRLVSKSTTPAFGTGEESD